MTGRRRKIGPGIVGALVFVCLMAGLAVNNAHAWWNGDWEYRKKITFDTTTTGSDIKENLSAVPVLLRLHSGNFNFVNAKEDGTDIRFVGSDDTTLLKYHMETYDTIDEIALLWVKLPKLAGGSDQNYVWMYYGNESAVGGQDPASTFDKNHVLVYHLSEVEQMPADATAYENHAASFQGGQGLPSVIGRGVMLNGAGEGIVTQPAPSLEDFSAGFTWSAWVRIAQAQADAWLFSRQDEEGALVIGVDDTKVYCRIVDAVAGTSRITEKVADLALDKWHRVAVTLTPEGRVGVYLDDLEITWMNLADPFTVPGGPVFTGASSTGEHSFVGDLDEVRLSSMARSDGWLQAAFKNQGPGIAFSGFGAEAVYEGGGLPTFYLGTVVKNITLDGMFIIFILMIFAMISWFIFIARAVLLHMAQRDNKGFKETFAQQNNVFGLMPYKDDYPNAPLYRIYRAGCEELKSRIGDPGHDAEGRQITLSAKGLKAVKAALEKNLLLETQSLNTWLVVLTMAITGGPFLGLLGTVWGVMNTFAAMAEAGEANIMAIAPGVASALSTTVFGLIVAIPALFGYNYLTSRIKAITVDLNVFVDDFAKDIDERYGDT
ncbi:MAG: MotA/TolQ/ExbB proton channel family protein [Thermodesulfobacteriota bacterium]|nr:MotA/TolQ/ExbB proton channel family protein [Thermodesulfobacteriota bacterium]